MGRQTGRRDANANVVLWCGLLFFSQQHEMECRAGFWLRCTKTNWKKGARGVYEGVKEKEQEEVEGEEQEAKDKREERHFLPFPGSPFGKRIRNTPWGSSQGEKQQGAPTGQSEDCFLSDAGARRGGRGLPRLLGRLAARRSPLGCDNSASAKKEKQEVVAGDIGFFLGG